MRKVSPLRIEPGRATFPSRLSNHNELWKSLDPALMLPIIVSYKVSMVKDWWRCSRHAVTRIRWLEIPAGSLRSKLLRVFDGLI